MSVQLHLVYGADDYWVEQKARAIVDAAVPQDQRALGLEAIDGRVDKKDDAVAAVRQTIEAVQTLGFFGASKLVWLRNASFLNPRAQADDGDAGEDASDETDAGRGGDALKDRLAELTALIKAGLPKGHILLITAPSVFRGSAFFKACQSTGEVIDFPLGEKNWEIEKLAAKRLARLLESRGLRMSEAVSERFLKRTGVSTRLMASELEKLSIYLGRGGAEVSERDVDAIVSVGREAEAWDLTDAIGERDPVKMARALRQLQSQEESAIRLVAMVESRVRDLMVMRTALDRKWIRIQGTYTQWEKTLPPEADAMLGGLTKDPRRLNGYPLGKQAAQATRYTMPELRRGRHLLIQLREKLVSSATRSPDAMVEIALFRLIRRPAAERSLMKVGPERR